ncbi:unnamed protein product [Rotaria socialis]|uniref:Uncharacterized protein n=3 Tax=Rotaria socialis TaxID=392032 RepID=A0A821RGR3_9BILA|nr:unnamed protein product [Rotaria socialis]CAF4843108.1 unnamed protein product [Rotaria socialis]
MHVQFNIPHKNENINHPSRMSTYYSNPTTTSYIDLRPRVNSRKPDLNGAAQRKTYNSYQKFQAGSTTTFSGYTNISTYNRNNNMNKNIFTRRTSHENNNYTKSSNNNYQNNNNNNRFYSNGINVPSLMTIDSFQLPSRRNCRTIQQAEQYKNRSSINQYSMRKFDNNDKPFSTTTKAYKFNGLILSDSMCRYVREEQVSSNEIKVNVSFESGCDCSRMLDYLNDLSINENHLLNVDFIVFSLCTNDVANYGPDIAIQRCRHLIERVRQLFPNIKSLGWLALSPRTKPSKLFNSLEINNSNIKFNQLLQNVAKAMNFEIINANLQQQHMHNDGLHPSIQSGRILIERRIHNWFLKQKNAFSNLEKNHTLKLYQSNNNIIQHQQTYTTNNRSTTAIHYKRNNNVNNVNAHHYVNVHNTNNNNNNNNDNDHNKNNVNSVHIKNKNYNDKYNNNNNKRNYNMNEQNNRSRFQKTTNYEMHMNINEYDMQHQLEKKLNYYQLSKIQIPQYPHFLRHKQEFFRKIQIPLELENRKDEIFDLSNIHYQTEYFKLESEKWEIYKKAAMHKKQVIEHVELMETIIEDNNNNLPIMRPSPSEATPGRKRKLGQRRDDPPTPPSPRQPPPVVPRKALPPRDSNAALIGGSVNSSPFSNEKQTKNKKEHSFNALLPIEKVNEKKQQEMRPVEKTITKENSIIISPIHSSTPEPMVGSPSVVPKNDVIPAQTSFHFAIIPIECRYFFKTIKEKCTFEAIKAHQNLLEKR